MSYQELYELYKRNYEELIHKLNEILDIDLMTVLTEHDKDCIIGEIREIVPTR